MSKIIDLAFAALNNGGDDTFQEELCECDPSVGMCPCQYCAIYDGLKLVKKIKALVDQKG